MRRPKFRGSCYWGRICNAIPFCSALMPAVQLHSARRSALFEFVLLSKGNHCANMVCASVNWASQLHAMEAPIQPCRAMFCLGRGNLHCISDDLSYMAALVCAKTMLLVHCRGAWLHSLGALCSIPPYAPKEHPLRCTKVTIDNKLELLPHTSVWY